MSQDHSSFPGGGEERDALPAPFGINFFRFSCFVERTSLVLEEGECGGKKKRDLLTWAAPRTGLELEPRDETGLALWK